MSTTCSAPTAAQDTAERFPDSGLAATLKRWWAAHIARREQRAAMAALGAMSDLELRDMGLRRCDIPRGVRGDVARDRTCIRRG